MIFFASAVRCHFRGGLVQYFGARAERTAGKTHELRIHPRLPSEVTEMWHLRCRNAHDGTQREMDNAFVY